MAQPEDYRWSSFQRKMGKRQDTWLDTDPVYLSLGRTIRQRVQRYRDFVQADIAPAEWQLIRNAILRHQLTGSERFIEEIAAKMGKRILHRGQGRPKKERDSSKK